MTEHSLLQGDTKFPPPSLYGFLIHLQKGPNFFWSPSRMKTREKRGRGGKEHCEAILSCFKTVIYEN